MLATVSTRLSAYAKVPTRITAFANLLDCAGVGVGSQSWIGEGVDSHGALARCRLGWLRGRSVDSHGCV